MQGVITHIQRMSLHDGPGIRSTIFLKGCNLQCKWCHNPETFSLQPELGWAQNKCIHCGTCIQKCAEGALSIQGDDIIARNKELCTGCNTCVSECYPGAHYRLGERYSVEQLCRMVEEDRRIFEGSGGGVTLSGGEPTIQRVFLQTLAEALHEKVFHVTLQTNLYAPWEVYETLLPYIDYFMCDLKHLDTEEHRRWTGQGNETILANLLRLNQAGVRYVVRTPVIPGVNNREDQLRAMYRFVSQLGNVEGYELLPFHPLASYKYHHMGMDYVFEATREIPQEEFAELKKQFEIR